MECKFECLWTIKLILYAANKSLVSSSYFYCPILPCTTQKRLKTLENFPDFTTQTHRCVIGHTWKIYNNPLLELSSHHHWKIDHDDEYLGRQLRKTVITIIERIKWNVSELN